MKPDKQEVRIILGLEFKSTHFAATARVSAIRPEMNEVDVIMMPSDGNEWEAKAWDLAYLKSGFEKEVFSIISKEPQLGVI